METLFICALFVYGVSVVINHTSEFFEFDLNVFYWYHKGTTIQKPAWQRFIMRPIFHCNVCMSSVWGSIYYVVSFGFVDPWSWILHCVISAAIIRIINNWVS